MKQTTDKLRVRNEIKDVIFNHDGWTELELFGKNLADAPLDRDKLTVFLASSYAFFREVPCGILALALRVADHNMDLKPFLAVSEGAHVQYSAVDEFGINVDNIPISETHHQIFLEMAKNWDICEKDLLDESIIIWEAKCMGAMTADFYRRQPLPKSLGFHAASELTSNREFVLCLSGLMAHPGNYSLNLIGKDPLRFYQIHTLVEPMHGSTSLDAAEKFCSDNDSLLAEVKSGSTAFMQGYQHFFRSLNAALFQKQ